MSLKANQKDARQCVCGISRDGLPEFVKRAKMPAHDSDVFGLFRHVWLLSLGTRREDVGKRGACTLRIAKLLEEKMGEAIHSRD